MNIPEPFLRSWQKMIEYTSEYLVQPTERIYYTRASVSYHSFARNSLVDQMQGEWLLQLDADVTFEPDLVARMLLKMDKFNIDVLVAPYLYKSDPHPPVLYGWNGKEKTLMGDWQRTGADLIPIWGAGAGCLLVRRKVFDTITKKLHCSPFDIYTDKQGTPHSEDHSFFARCWKLKIPVYAHPDLFVNHLIYKELKVDTDYVPNRENLKRDIKNDFWKPHKT